MKFLTIRQPWASLIAVGAKTIETRPFSTTYRGPLAIHAGKAWPVPVGEWQVPSDRGAGPMVERLVSLGRAYVRWESMPLPLGAVVAVCDLVDVVPIRFCTMDYAHVCHSGAELLLHSDIARPWADGETEHIVTDQLPFGDFTPGRFAWLIDSVRPLPSPVPMRGAQGLRDVPADIASAIQEQIG